MKLEGRTERLVKQIEEHPGWEKSPGLRRYRARLLGEEAWPGAGTLRIELHEQSPSDKSPKKESEEDGQGG